MKPVEILADYMDRLIDPTSERDLLADVAEAVFTIAEAIVADPEAHINALVEAGVLKSITLKSIQETAAYTVAYTVVPPEPPHVHEWMVPNRMAVTSTHVKLACVGCGDVRWVANKLPIEVPE